VDERSELVMLATIPQSALPVYPVNWNGLPLTYLNAGELEIIVALVRSAAKQDIVVEIGLAQGRTAKAILRELPQVKRYIGVDTDPNYRTKLVSQWTERASSPGFLALDDPRFDRWLLPRGSLDLTADDFPPVDAVFIDGDHSREVVRHDIDLARAIVESGGMIIWHDYMNHGVEVSRVLELDQHHGHDIRHVENTWLAFERC
jgi:predicted O-methyltransferase YrrM